MDANELKAFENLVSLTESQAKTISSLQALEKLQPVFNRNSKDYECEKGYPAIIDPNITWSAQSFPIHEGMNLVIILARAERCRDQ